MKQTDNLFQNHARCVGLETYYDVNLFDDGIAGKLTIHPKWSKRPDVPGDVYVVIDEHLVDVVPELWREAFNGMQSVNPGYYIPRWVNKHLQDYERASHK